MHWRVRLDEMVGMWSKHWSLTFFGVCICILNCFYRNMCCVVYLILFICASTPLGCFLFKTFPCPLHHLRRRSFGHPLAEVAKLLGVPPMRRFSVWGFHGFGRWGAKVLDMFNMFFMLHNAFLRTWGLDMFAWVVLRSFAKTYQYGNGSWIKVYIF